MKKLKKFLSEKDRDELIFGIFDAYRDMVIINGLVQKVEASHRMAVWKTILEAIHVSKHVATHPSISTLDQLIEIIVTFRIERQADVLIYRVMVGNHGLCTAV